MKVTKKSFKKLHNKIKELYNTPQIKIKYYTSLEGKLKFNKLLKEELEKIIK